MVGVIYGYCVSFSGCDTCNSRCVWNDCVENCYQFFETSEKNKFLHLKANFRLETEEEEDEDEDGFLRLKCKKVI